MTQVLAGEGRYIIINVGKNSAIGTISSLVDTKDQSSLLSHRDSAAAEARVAG